MIIQEKILSLELIDDIFICSSTYPIHFYKKTATGSNRIKHMNSASTTHIPSV